jgi:mRNA-degrading endonuclease toxin of MazEF toxin-antitoxin module
MRRGEIWSYSPVIARPGQSLVRLIVSADFMNDSPSATVLGLHIRDLDPGTLLAPRIGEFGWANVMTIEAVVRSRLVEKVGEATPPEMEQVDNALRAVQDL